MALFQRSPQRITVYSEKQSHLEAFISLLKAEKLKDAKISSLTYSEEEWCAVIHCKDAEILYYEQILPLLYASAETQSFRVMLELDDKSEPARRCPREIMVSFELKSKYAFGDKADIAFVKKLRRDIVEGVFGSDATVCYYIIGGGSVTMSIPCLELSIMDDSLQNAFKDYGIKRFMINIVEREPA